MKVFLETDRLLLRQFTSADVDRLFELDSDPEVTQFTDPACVYGDTIPNYDVIQNHLLPRWLAYYEQGDYGFWAAIEKSSQAFIGWFHLRPPAVSNQAVSDHELELGYRLRKASWGQGYATEGSKALIAKAFTELRCDRVTATALTDNHASIRVMEKAGLKFETFWIYQRTQQQAVRYALNRDEFIAHSPCLDQPLKP